MGFVIYSLFLLLLVSEFVEPLNKSTINNTLFQDTQIIIDGINKADYDLSPESYDLSSDDDDENIYYEDTFDVDKVIDEKCIDDIICVRKCCESNEVFNSVNFTCENGRFEKLWEPEFHGKNLEKVSSPHGIEFIHSFPCNYDGYIEHEFYLMSDGRLYTPTNNRQENVKEYCLDNFFNETHVITQAFVCFPSETDTTCRSIKAYLLVVSATFLAITVLCYILMPELRSNLHGKVLISYVTALLISYIGLSIIQLGSQVLSPTVCKSIHIMIHYFMLAAFFWLNIMSFDVWRTLRSMRPQGKSRSSEMKRLLTYSLYSWGCPLVISSITIIIDQLNQNDKIIVPSLGTGGCWFDSYSALWVYLYSYILIIMIINTGFYIDVARILFEAQKSRMKMLKNNTVKEKERMMVYMRLFIIMGITWIFEVISAGFSHNNQCYIWIFTDSLNALQGLFIFLVFICKKSTLLKIRNCIRENSEDVSISWASKRTGSTSLSETAKQRDTIRKSRFDSPKTEKKFEEYSLVETKQDSNNEQVIENI